MALDPNISLHVRVPEINADPLAQYGRVAQVRNLLMQGQLHQQQILNEQEALKGEQLKNTETERAQGAQRMLSDLVSKNTTQDANGEPKTDHFAVIKGLSAAGNAKEAAAYDTQRRLDLKSELDNQKQKLDIGKQQVGQFASLLGPVRQAPADQQPVLYSAARTQAIQGGLAKPQDIPEQYDPGFVEQHFQAAVDADKQIDNHQKAVEFAQKLNEAAPKTMKEWSEAAFNQGAAARSQQELDLTRQALKMNGAPPQILAQLPQMWSQAAVDALGQKAMTAEQRAQEADRAAARTEVARHNKIEEGLSGGRLNVERTKEAREQKVFDQTYGEGSNEALRGVEPKLRVPATREAQKAADDYNKAQTAAMDMKTFLDLARSGNKAAGSNLPLVGVSTINALNGIKRINQAEITQYEGAGSLLDRIQGKIGKLVVGQPIPADVLNDIESLHKTLAGNSVETYNKKLDGINQNYKSSFKPVGGPAKPATASAPTMIRARDPQGNLHEAPAGTALPAGWKLEGGR